jgi:predicted HAD superfamily Cof-like phosphohydrolase
MTTKLREQVAEFHRVFGQEIRETPGIPDEATVRLRGRLVIEEAFEFVDALLEAKVDKDYLLHLRHRVYQVLRNAPVRPDLVAVADALADIDYVSEGSRLAFGFDGERIADEVQASNMAKAPGGVVEKTPEGKIVKPPGWSPPNVAAELRRQGWMNG